MDRVYTALDYLILMMFLMLTINFAYSTFETLYNFYQWMIIMSFAFSIGSVGFFMYVWKKDTDLRATDTFTGTILGAFVLLVANFVIALLYSTTAPAQSLTLSVLQLNTGIIASNFLLHAILIAPTEEIVFRGVLFDPFRILFERFFGQESYYPTGLAFGFSSGIYFAIAHQVVLAFNPVLLLFPILSSVVLVYIRVRFGLYASVNAHRINNVVSLIM
jgi:membrane protease YdiL (CAAX protease family)